MTLTGLLSFSFSLGTDKCVIAGVRDVVVNGGGSRETDLVTGSPRGSERGRD
jgi:hypothetical protein